MCKYRKPYVLYGFSTWDECHHPKNIGGVCHPDFECPLLKKELEESERE